MRLEVAVGGRLGLGAHRRRGLQLFDGKRLQKVQQFVLRQIHVADLAKEGLLSDGERRGGQRVEVGKGGVGGQLMVRVHAPLDSLRDVREEEGESLRLVGGALGLHRELGDCTRLPLERRFGHGVLLFGVGGEVRKEVLEAAGGQDGLKSLCTIHQ